MNESAKRRAADHMDSTTALLAAFFRRNGYVRLQNQQRLEEEGPASYRKGDEIRLVASSARELRLIRSLLKEAGFRPGRDFVKGRQYRVPIYGRDAVARFLEMVEAEPEI